MSDLSHKLQDQVKLALENKQTLDIAAGNSKAFLFPQRSGQSCELSGHQGVVDYEPNELVITLRSGTPLREVESTLKEQAQMLPFEPPHYGDGATIGGSVACNLSGPRRPYSGALRDFVLGMKLINGSAEILNLGGRVIKNVAGYDASRLMCGAYGHLGIILEVSLKVLPIPTIEFTLFKKMQMDEAIWTMTQTQSKSWPISGCCYVDQHLYVRINAQESIAKDIAIQLSAELYPSTDFWHRLKEQQLDFFQARPDQTLWRVSCPPAYSHIHHISDDCLMDWGGALRWFWCPNERSEKINQILLETGIHAMQFRGENRQFIFPSLGALQPVHEKLKDAFDPAHLFNPGKAYHF